ncbi:MAG: sugar-binding transcriptional regulator [Armatimonadota bacterium]|nr:sugar-binding transcriptional regulator [Armatimonadota bacterium]
MRPRHDDRHLMAKVADLYYLRGLTQQEIAGRLGLSRPAVCRLLQRARAEGVVRIEVIPPQESHQELERELEERFGLREAVVVTGRTESPTLTRRALGQAAALALERYLKGRELIGVSWGTTLNEVVHHVRPRPLRTTVVPLVGGAGQVAPGVHANDLARRLAQAHRGEVHLLHAPAIVASAEVQQALCSDPNIRRVLDMARQADVALVGVGALVASSTLVQSGYFSAREFAALRERGAVGDVCTRPYTREGLPVDDELQRRIVAVEFEDLRRIPTVVAVAGGLEKAEAILGLLCGELADVLVTDHVAARAVLRSLRAERGVEQ